jgi:hypothetical protein
MLLNAFHEDQTFALPEAGGEGTCQWELLMDTTRPEPPSPSGKKISIGDAYVLGQRAFALFRRVEP